MTTSVVRRLSFWIAICQFLGTCLISYSFRIQPASGVFFNDRPLVTLEAESLSALYSGWGLIVFGFLMQVVAEIRPSLEPTPLKLKFLAILRMNA